MGLLYFLPHQRSYLCLILAAPLSSGPYTLPLFLLSFLTPLLADQLSHDVPDQSSPLSGWMQMNGLIFFRLLKGSCYSNQFWDQNGEICVHHLHSLYCCCFRTDWKIATAFDRVHSTSCLQAALLDTASISTRFVLLLFARGRHC